MKHLLFTVYDEKAEVFLPPFFCPAIGIATRAFTDCVNGNDHQFAAHPSDYTLFQLGSFDDHNALLDHIPKKSLGNGVEFLETKHVSALEEFHSGPPNTSIQPDKNS